LSLVARCPACGTAFRVQPAQLAARGGKVRCGRCGAVFDGVSALVDGESVVPAEDVAAAPDETDAGGAAQTDFLRAAEPVPRYTLLWSFAAFLALLALLGQGLLHYRTELATRWPPARPFIAAACGLAGCELRLPRHAGLLSIESSDIEPDGARAGVVVLNAVVRNRAPYAQEYPALELTLTDERDYAVVRRVLRPADYLRFNGPERIPEGLAAGAEAVLRVYLQNAGAAAVGYRLYLFYP
jgi:predicted Zn finger-like uncharacterized protein